MSRKIIHIDMDAFYASVEQRDDPELRGKPVVVGGNPNGRGVVAAASYEARRFGVRSAMSSAQAKRLCPHLIFARVRFDTYREASKQIMEIFREYSDLVEPLSLDEAYLDVTENKKSIPYASEVAKEIKAKILEKTKLTASAGAAPNKFLAKIASDMNKPDGLTVIRPERVAEVLAELPVRKIPGVGRVTEEKMVGMGILTTEQIRSKSEDELVRAFGKSGRWFYNIARGIDERVVSPSRERKSVGAENTFSEDLTDLVEMRSEIERIATKTAERMSRVGARARTVTLKVKYSDFKQITRSKTFDCALSDETELVATALDLFTQTEAGDRPVRLLGVSTSHLEFGEETAREIEVVDLLPLQLEFEF